MALQATAGAPLKPITSPLRKRPQDSPNHALIFGATGIQGWAVTNELLKGHRTSSSFSKITALTNRPLTDEILWPISLDAKLQVISGIDLLSQDIEAALQRNVPNIQTVTHVFFFAYIYNPDPTEESKINLSLLQQAISAVESLSPNLQFVVLSTGTKAYGVHCSDDFPFADHLPLSESLPRIPEPWASQNFYYHQTDWLAAQSKDKRWTWCELRPDIVVGFVPNNNVYCLAQLLATYLACYREVEGEGAECLFPGTAKGWTILSNDSGQDEIARFAIHAALHPETCGGGQAINVASRGKPSSWSEKWPVICDFFGLKGVAPPEEGKGPHPNSYLADHFEQWKEMERKYGLATGRVGNDRSQAEILVMMFEFDRPLDLSRMQAAWGGRGREADSKEAWWTAFQRFGNAKIIP